MDPVLVVHITAGTIGVLSGGAALSLRKGARFHRLAGIVFVAAMSVMAMTAAIVGRSDVDNAVAGGLTIYLVATSLVTVRRRENKAGLFEIGAFLVAAVFALLFAYSAYQLFTGEVEPANPFIFGVTVMFTVALALAALGDLSVALRGGLSGAQRLARHLWRMCLALLIAVGSFMAQGVDALPHFVPGAQLLLGSMLIVLSLMSYWLVRVLFIGRNKPIAVTP